MSVRTSVWIPSAYVRLGAVASIYNSRTSMVGWTVETGESPEAHKPANLDNERMSQTRWKVKTIPKIVF